MIKVENLTKHYGHHIAVQNVSFMLEKNTKTALIGPNGAGKTTILSMLTQLTTATSGRCWLPPPKEIGFLPQYPKFYSWLNAEEYLMMVAQLSGLTKKQAILASAKVIEVVDLIKDSKRKIEGYSGGMKQRLGIAQALIHQPTLLLLDEPVSALDPIGRRDVMNIIHNLQDTTVLYATHILHDAEQVTDNVLFIQDGQIKEQGSLQEVKQKYGGKQLEVVFYTVQDAMQFAAQMPSKVEGERVLLSATRYTMHQLLAIAAPHSEKIKRLGWKEPSLEDIFLEVGK